jgi:hypothetical protein
LVIYIILERVVNILPIHSSKAHGSVSLTLPLLSPILYLPHPIINIGEEIMWYDRFYEWLFSEEERKPIGFIPLFFIIIIISTTICLFILSVGRAIMWI